VSAVETSASVRVTRAAVSGLPDSKVSLTVQRAPAKPAPTPASVSAAFAELAAIGTEVQHLLASSAVGGLYAPVIDPMPPTRYQSSPDDPSEESTRTHGRNLPSLDLSRGGGSWSGHGAAWGDPSGEVQSRLSPIFACWHTFVLVNGLYCFLSFSSVLLVPMACCQ
jgi:hypothetical protein